MNLTEIYIPENKNKPFKDYEEYTEYLFYLVDYQLNEYLESMKILFAARDGSYKNVLYPDLEIASDICSGNIASMQFKLKQSMQADNEDSETDNEDSGTDSMDDMIPDDLASILGEFVL